MMLKEICMRLMGFRSYYTSDNVKYWVRFEKRKNKNRIVFDDDI